MKFLALILSIVIFSQSLSVCGPPVAHRQKMLPVKECKIDLLGLKSNKTHSCCSKKDKTSHDKEKKDCCGENCKCFCCAKVCIDSLYFYKTLESDLSVFAEQNIPAIKVHSFDFHPSISYPPQV